MLILTVKFPKIRSENVGGLEGEQPILFLFLIGVSG